MGSRCPTGFNAMVILSAQIFPLEALRPISEASGGSIFQKSKSKRQSRGRWLDATENGTFVRVTP